MPTFMRVKPLGSGTTSSAPWRNFILPSPLHAITILWILFWTAYVRHSMSVSPAEAQSGAQYFPHVRQGVSATRIPI